jgi:septal ring factor EnvC (AmiA/AmiB activator)
MVFYGGSGQSISELRQKKEKAAKEIEYTTKLLDEVQKDERASLTRLRLLNNRLQQRNLLISNISNEIDVYQEFIDDNIYAVQMLQQDLEGLKKEYAELIRLAYRNVNTNNAILFLLSAENFNQAYRRFLYMKRYTSYRQKQAETIDVLQELLNEKASKLKDLQQVKQQLIIETEQETQKIAREKLQQNAETQQLQKQKRSLQEKLNQQRRIEQQLESEIQRIIEEEASKNRETGAPEFALTPEQKLIGNNFEQNKRRLPWPTARGVITEHFGIHQHPVLSNVQIRNNGINISTEAGAQVRAVFDGEVTRVFGISGGNSAVILRHGKYLTVYSNLSEVVVKRGDKVQTRQIIGKVFTDEDDGNKSILKFQIWRENQKLDPEEWIGR